MKETWVPHGSQSNITQQSTGDFSRKNPELPHLRLEPSTQRWYSRFLQPYRQQPDGSKVPQKKNRLQKIYGSNFETKIYIQMSSFFGEVKRIKIIFWSSISDISKTPAIAQVKAYSTIIPEIWPMDVSRAWLLRQLQQWGSSKIWAPPKSLKKCSLEDYVPSKMVPFRCTTRLFKKRMSSTVVVSSFLKLSGWKFMKICSENQHQGKFTTVVFLYVHHPNTSLWPLGWWKRDPLPPTRGWKGHFESPGGPGFLMDFKSPSYTDLFGSVHSRPTAWQLLGSSMAKGPTFSN